MRHEMDDKYINQIKNELRQIKFSVVSPCLYAADLRTQFRENPLKWLNVIMPEEKAIELREKTKNDFSLIWHAHCYCCWKNIDKNTNEECFLSENKAIWLCAGCYKKLKG